MSGGLSCLPRRGCQSAIWPDRGSSGLCCPGGSDLAWAVRPEESGVAPGCRARGRVGSPPRRCWGSRGSGRGAGTCGRVACAQWKWEGFGRLRPLPGPGDGAGDLGAVCASDPGESPLCARGAARPGWEASVTCCGAPSADPRAPPWFRRAPLGDTTERSGNLCPRLPLPASV